MDLQYGGRAGSPVFTGQKSDSLVPGVAASQDILKEFFKSEFGVESDSKKFHMRIDFKSLAVQFRVGSGFPAR